MAYCANKHATVPRTKAAVICRIPYFGCTDGLAQKGAFDLVGESGVSTSGLVVGSSASVSAWCDSFRSSVSPLSTSDLPVISRSYCRDRRRKSRRELSAAVDRGSCRRSKEAIELYSTSLGI